MKHWVAIQGVVYEVKPSEYPNFKKHLLVRDDEKHAVEDALEQCKMYLHNYGVLANCNHARLLELEKESKR